jgi:hypothetical protein
MDRRSVSTADGVRTVANPGRPSLTTPKMPTSPNRAVVEEIAREQKRADDSLAHRMAMDVLGLTDDPLKAAIEKVIPERVDIHGNRPINPLKEVPERAFPKDRVGRWGTGVVELPKKRTVR